MNMTTVPSNQLKAMQQEVADLKEQLAHLRIETDFNFEQYQDAGRLMFELQEQLEQQAEAIRLKDEALEKIACIGNGNSHGNSIGNCLAIDALAIQPSSDILQARDKGVAEAITKYLRAVGVLSYEGTALQGIISGEWRKYL